MKLMTIWRAYNESVRIVSAGHAKSQRAENLWWRRVRQYFLFRDKLEKHLQEWDDDIEAIERLLDAADGIDIVGWD